MRAYALCFGTSHKFFIGQYRKLQAVTCFVLREAVSCAKVGCLQSEAQSFNSNSCEAQLFVLLTTVLIKSVERFNWHKLCKHSRSTGATYMVL